MGVCVCVCTHASWTCSPPSSCICCYCMISTAASYCCTVTTFSHLQIFQNIEDRQDLRLGRDKLAAKSNMTARQAVRMSCADGVLCTLQLWRHAIHYTAEVVLEGIAKVKTRCSAIGRNAMSSGKCCKGFALDPGHNPCICPFAALHETCLLVTPSLPKEGAKF